MYTSEDTYQLGGDTVASTYKELVKEAKKQGLNPFGMTKVDLEQALLAKQPSLKQQSSQQQSQQQSLKRTRTQTKSSKIRDLYDEGHTVAQIAKELRLNYAFVYGVVKRHTSKTSSEQPKKQSKASKIRELHDKGYTRAEICRELKVDYSNVYHALRNYITTSEEVDAGEDS